MEKNKIMKYCDGFCVSEYNGNVIIANSMTGMNFKMTRECYDILNEFIKKKITINEFLTWFKDKNDMEYFERVMNVLTKYYIITPEDDKQELSVSLELTNRCNLCCKHCCMDAVSAAENTDLSTDTWMNIIDKLDGIGITSLIFTGGEPLMRNDIFELAEYAKKRLNVPLILMSNATLITSENAERIFNLFESYSFSLDGADEESCAAVRGCGVFERALKGINIMRDMGMKNYSLSFTKVKQNQHTIDKFYKLADEMGAYPMVRNFNVVGRGKEHLELLPDDIDSVFQAAIVAYPNGKDHYPPDDMPMCISCGAIRAKFAIGHDGSIYPCISLLQPEFIMGNILDIDSFPDFYKNKLYKDSEGFKLFYNMHPAYSPDCADCPVRLFCDSCVQYTYRMKNHPDYKLFCEKKRKDLMRVW